MADDNQMHGVPPELVEAARKMLNDMEEQLPLKAKSISTVRLELKVTSPDMQRSLIVRSKALSETGDPYTADPDPDDGMNCD